MHHRRRTVNSARFAIVLTTILMIGSSFAVAGADTSSPPNFLDETSVRLPATSEISVRAEAGDIDGDRDLDIIVVAGNHTAVTGYDPNATDIQLLMNDGTGTFTEEAASRLPAAGISNPAGAAARFGDVDGDDDLDIFVAHGATGGRLPSTFAGFQNNLWINQGGGVFSDETGARLPAALDSSMDATFGDVDRDGDLDLFVANTTFDGTSARNKLLVNDGSGVFQDDSAARLPSEADISMAVAMADLDLDDDIDIVVGNASGQPTKVLINMGNGIFENRTAGALSRSVSAAGLAIGDLTGNGCPDILVAHLPGTPRLFGGACDGSFDDGSAPRLPATASGVLGVTIADVDGDGDIDIFAAVPGAQQRLFLNDGSGHFSDGTASHIPPLEGIVRYPVFVDVDADGDPDIFVPMWFDGDQARDRLLINQADFVNNQAPDCSAAGPSIERLWPADLKFVEVHVVGVTDPEGQEVVISIDSVRQDEPVARPRSRQRAPDALIDDSIAKLRAERLGKRNGRVYAIAFSAMDTEGASCSGSVNVGVPKKQKTEPIDDGPAFDSTQR